MGSRFLFAGPSFFEGVGRILDFGGTLTEYNESLTPQQADYFAMRADWALVGHDIRKAIRDIEPELAEKR